jgi:hypothetical protein
MRTPQTHKLVAAIQVVDFPNVEADPGVLNPYLGSNIACIPDIKIIGYNALNIGPVKYGYAVNRLAHGPYLAIDISAKRLGKIRGVVVSGWRYITAFQSDKSVHIAYAHVALLASDWLADWH